MTPAPERTRRGIPSPDVLARDLEAIERWWEAIVEDPSRLPAGVDLVQSKLVRVVGRARLPSGSGVFLKAMGYPRAKDKLRYAFRTHPLVHEAAMLRHLGAAGLPVPEVLFARGTRRGGLPHACLLVTAALETVETETIQTETIQTETEAGLPADAALSVVFGLCEAGVFHGDLHTDNFLVLDPTAPAAGEHSAARGSGSVGLIDMQSARRRRAVSPAEVRRMVATLVSRVLICGGDFRPWEAALLARGFSVADVQRIRRQAELRNHAALRGRLDRCLRESTQFAVRRGPLRTSYERRVLEDAGAPAGEWVEGGGEMFRYWIGDRALEVLDDAAPVLTTLERPMPWTPRPHRLKLVGGGEVLDACRDRLLDGFERYHECTKDPADV